MIKLTQTVKKGGCAAKIPALILKDILAGVSFPPVLPEVLIDGKDFDDAAIFRISDELSLVQTLDFFTPIVNSPYDFGAIATANALSDVYAMGGQPKTCMAILAAPMSSMEPSVIKEVLQGASDIMAKANASLVGGHSIDDDTLKFGLSVTGLVNTKAIWSNAGALPDDALILTKPLGTGTICAGIKKDSFDEQDSLEVRQSMMRLNNVVDFLSAEQKEAIHAATDVTGFGLAGHGFQMAKASKVSFKIIHQNLPLFKLTRKSLADGNLTKAHLSNLEYTSQHMVFHDLNEIERKIYFDPQTSGGLLLSVSASMAESIVRSLATDFPGTAIIGKVIQQKTQHLYVE